MASFRNLFSRKKSRVSNSAADASNAAVEAAFLSLDQISFNTGTQYTSSVWAAVSLIADAVASREFEGASRSLTALAEGDGVHRGSQFIRALVEGALLTGNVFIVRDGVGFRMTTHLPSVTNSRDGLQYTLQFPTYSSATGVVQAGPIAISRVGHIRFGRVSGTGTYDMFAKAPPSDLLNDWQNLIKALVSGETGVLSNGNRLLGTLATNEQFDSASESENNMQKVNNRLKELSSGNSVTLPRGYSATRIPRVEADRQFELVVQNFVAEVARVYRVPLEMLGQGSNRPTEGTDTLFQRHAVFPVLREVEAALRLVLNDDSFQADDILSKTTDQATAVMRLAQTGVVGDIELREMLGLPEQRRGELPQTAGAPDRGINNTGA